MHPWLRLAWQHPEQLTEHAAAYAALAAEEAGQVVARAAARGRRQLLIVASLMVGAMLAGTALLIWAALPSLPDGRVFWFVAVPLAPFLVAAFAWQRDRSPPAGADFRRLRAQLALDRQAWDAARTGERPQPAASEGRP